MRAFLSHSSKDKPIVGKIHAALGAEAAWLDAAEIELGAILLERIAAGIEEAADFVLFWSEHSSASAWVRHEIHMGFIRSLEDKALRMIVIRLDNTPVPLYLRPYLYLDASQTTDPVAEIVAGLRKKLSEPAPPVRVRFVNRNSEIGRIESILDTGGCSALFLRGMQGIGKRSLVQEAFRRLFEGDELVVVRVNDGMGAVELALLLSAHVGESPPQDGTPLAQVFDVIALRIEQLLAAGRFVVFEDVQHWLREDGAPEEVMAFVLRRVADTPLAKKRPLVMTTTRRVRNDYVENPSTADVWVDGLATEHLATLLQWWHELSGGRSLERDSALRLAGELAGYPVAARLAAPLIASFGEAYLRDYPREMVLLRRDLARRILNEIRLSEPSRLLMEALAITRIPLPAGVVAAGLGLSDAELQEAISQCVDAGLIKGARELSIHPLVEDHFWNRHLHREGYKELSAKLAESLWGELQNLDIESVQFASLLPVVFRLFALAGELPKALQLRRDLIGTLSDAAMTLYRRRDYKLAKAYASQVLETEPRDWGMRLLTARVAIREEDWDGAKKLLDGLLTERPGDIAIRHALGWRLLRMRRFEDALAVLLEIVAHRDHVQSLRDAADCLHQLKRDKEALVLLGRARAVESANAYVLELEAQILEGQGDLAGALVAAEGAVNRDPGAWSLHHRLGRIRSALRDFDGAIEEFKKAVEVAPDEFTPLASLADELLNRVRNEEAEVVINRAEQNARSKTQRGVVGNLRGRLFRAKGQLEEAEALVEREVSYGTNEPFQSGLLVLIEIDLARRRQAEGLPAMAKMHVAKGRAAIDRVESLAPDSTSIAGWRDQMDQMS